MSWMEVWDTETDCELRWRQMGLNAERGFLPESDARQVIRQHQSWGEEQDTLITVTAPTFL